MSERNLRHRNRRTSSSMDISSPGGNRNHQPPPTPDGQRSKNGGRKRHRRAGKGGEKHRRKWKPYDKLSWEEKRQLSEKEAIVAEKKREDALRHGHPVAPFNTTQFIMEEHSSGKGITPQQTVANRNINTSEYVGSGPNSGFASQQDTPLRDDGDDYFEREYSAALENVRVERLQNMNSEQLRAEVLRLEVDIDTLNKVSFLII